MKIEERKREKGKKKNESQSTILSTLNPQPSTLACAAPYGVGGMGQHLAQLVEEARAQSLLDCYYAIGVKAEDAAGRSVEMSRFAWLAQYTPMRFSSGWKSFVGNDWFDGSVAAQLRSPVGVFIGFQGQALRSFQRAKTLGAKRLELVSAGTHVNHVARQQKRARQLHNLEHSWLNEALRRKTLREYAIADTIQVSSEHAYQTFRQEGVEAARLRRVELATAPRFVPPANCIQDGVFRIVCTGSLTVMKGIPILLEAFAQMRHPQVELTLVGSWAGRNMRRYLQAWQARDPRLCIGPGDPLPHLQRADVYVHPTWDDGWGYAPMEALACGVPVIVTEDTGMKERVREGVNGYIVPTGDWQALLERLEQIRAHPPAPFLPPLVSTTTAGEHR